MFTESITHVVIQDRRLRVHHVAKRLGVPRRTIRYWAKKGYLPAVKEGPRTWGFNSADVEAFRLRLIAHQHLTPYFLETRPPEVGGVAA